MVLLDEQLAHIRRRLQRITAATAAELVALHGAGPDTASTLLVTAGDNPDRLQHEKSFASLTGSSPLDASSGKRQRHRLNRGGDRQANAAHSLRFVDDRERQWQETQAAASTFLGLTKATAQSRAIELGLRLRLVDWDELGDQAVALTSDLRVDRLTLHVRNGVVTASDPG